MNVDVGVGEEKRIESIQLAYRVARVKVAGEEDKEGSGRETSVAEWNVISSGVLGGSEWIVPISDRIQNMREDFQSNTPNRKILPLCLLRAGFGR